MKQQHLGDGCLVNDQGVLEFELITTTPNIWCPIKDHRFFMRVVSHFDCMSNEYGKTWALFMEVESVDGSFGVEQGY